MLVRTTLALTLFLGTPVAWAQSRVDLTVGRHATTAVEGGSYNKAPLTDFDHEGSGLTLHLRAGERTFLSADADLTGLEPVSDLGVGIRLVENDFSHHRYTVLVGWHFGGISMSGGVDRTALEWDLSAHSVWADEVRRQVRQLHYTGVIVRVEREQWIGPLQLAASGGFNPYLRSSHRLWYGVPGDSPYTAWEEANPTFRGLEFALSAGLRLFKGVGIMAGYRQRKLFATAENGDDRAGLSFRTRGPSLMATYSLDGER